LTVSEPAVIIGAMSFHENLARQAVVQRLSSRTFGITFATIFALISIEPLIHHESPRLGFAIAAALLCVLALVRPRWLDPLNQLWLRFTMAMNMLVGLAALALIFFLGFLPMAIALRIAGRDPLRRKRSSDTSSYWIPREAVAEPESMTRQF
jgi:hypothetical protein